MKRPSIIVLVVATATATLFLAAPVGAEHDGPEGTIAMASNRSGSTDIWVVAADGTSATDLTPVPGAELWPAYSPDGGTIAFTRGAGFARELWLMNADGTNQRRLTTNTSGENGPEWSPDGSRIAVARFAPDFSVDLWVIDPAGVAPDLRLTEDPDFDSFPTWSPDGEWIAFSSGRGGVDAVWRIRADGSGGLEQLTPSELSAGTPEWSHDGKHIALVDNVCGTCDESDVWLLKLENGKLTQVTDTPGNELFPDWSPDDEWLTYERGEIVDGNLLLPDVFVQRVKHGTAINITNSPGVLDFEPTWAPEAEDDD